MYVQDLSTSVLFSEGSSIRAIGWLSLDHPYSQGRVEPIVLQKLKQIAERAKESQFALNWPFPGGFHVCEFCCSPLKKGGLKDKKLPPGAMGALNFAIPHNGLLYICPKMIVHYIEKHNYYPPAEFHRAVLDTPLPGTTEYQEAVAPYALTPEDEARLFIPF